MEELFFLLFCQIQRFHEFHHVCQTLVGIVWGEDDAVDAEGLLGTLKGDFRHDAAGRHKYQFPVLPLDAEQAWGREVDTNICIFNVKTEKSEKKFGR